MSYTTKLQAFLDKIALELNNDVANASINPNKHNGWLQLLVEAINEHANDTQSHSGGFPAGTKGDLLFHTGEDWGKLSAGTLGQLLTISGTEEDKLPAWLSPSFNVLSLLTDTDGYAKAQYKSNTNGSYDLYFVLKKAAIVDNVTGKKVYLAISGATTFETAAVGVFYVDLADFDAAEDNGTVPLKKELTGSMPSNAVILSNYLGTEPAAFKACQGELITLINNYYKSNNGLKYISVVDGVATLDFSEPWVKDYMIVLDGTDTTLTIPITTTNIINDAFSGRIIFSSANSDTTVTLGGAFKPGVIVVPRTSENSEVGFEYGSLNFWQQGYDLLWTYNKTGRHLLSENKTFIGATDGKAMEISWPIGYYKAAEFEELGDVINLNLDHEYRYSTNFFATTAVDIDLRHKNRPYSFNMVLRLEVISNTIKVYSEATWDIFSPTDQRVNVADKYITLTPGIYRIDFSYGIYYVEEFVQTKTVGEYRVSANLMATTNQTTNLPKLTANKMWVGNENGVPEEADIPSSGGGSAYLLTLAENPTYNDGIVKVIKYAYISDPTKYYEERFEYTNGLATKIELKDDVAGTWVQKTDIYNASEQLQKPTLATIEAWTII